MEEQPDASSFRAFRRPLQLAFVNFSSKQERVSPSTRQLIRSTATAHSHRDPSRKPKIRKSKRSKSLRDHEAASMKQLEQNLQRVFSIPEDEPAEPDTFLQPCEGRQLARIVDHWDSTRNLAISSTSAGLADEPTTFTYPVPDQPWFEDVLRYYRTEYQPDGMYNLMKCSLEEGQQYMDWEKRKSFSEPAVLYKQLFVAATQWVAEGKLSESTLLWIQSRCYEALNEALCDPQRVSSPEIVLVVASFAHWTYLYDDVPTGPLCHVKAFRCLLDMHGGLEKIDMPRIGFKLLQLFDEQIESRRAGVVRPRGVRYTCAHIFRTAFSRVDG